ncbi:MAG TPA: NUDIX hydrolase, partial [Candidatus Saccharimonadales bacterium]|nr:NUDIX hydrolase [Candidatus Saccharimonadales bacterium]
TATRRKSNMPAMHRVSCKVALYSPDGRQVLLMRYPQLGPQAYGLPGGHLEDGEEPDRAVLREIREELGVQTDPKLMRTDFWRHDDGKIVLGYIGRHDLALPASPDPDFEYAQWVSLADLAEGKINAGSYDSFVIRNQPRVE